MGLFSKKETIGEITFLLYPNYEMIIQNSFAQPDQWNRTIMAFSLFLAKIVSDLGKELGTGLWNSIFRLSSVAMETIQKKDDVPVENKILREQTLFRVVQSTQSTANYLKETGRIVRKGDSFYCNTFSSPSSYPNIELTVMAGFEAAFVHLFNSGSKEIKVFLPIVLINQCNWYHENGFPSIRTLYDAPQRGIEDMMRRLGIQS